MGKNSGTTRKSTSSNPRALSQAVNAERHVTSSVKPTTSVEPKIPKFYTNIEHNSDYDSYYYGVTFLEDRYVPLNLNTQDSTAKKDSDIISRAISNRLWNAKNAEQYNYVRSMMPLQKDDGTVLLRIAKIFKYYDKRDRRHVVASGFAHKTDGEVRELLADLIKESVETYAKEMSIKRPWRKNNKIYIGTLSNARYGEPDEVTIGDCVSLYNRLNGKK